MSKYKQITEGEWVEPVHRGHKLACCDCGLVHTVDFKVVKGSVLFRVKRDERATAAMRRPMRFSKDD